MATFFRPSSIEPLESRIAPASLIFTDVDGDVVTITTSKGADADLTAAAHLVASGSGQQLQLLDLTAKVFQGSTLTIDSVAEGGGDGFVNVGAVDATNRDLGAVVIDGDLGRILAGRSAGSTSVASLEVKSMGALGTTTQGAGGDLHTIIGGKLGPFTVHTSKADSAVSILEAQIEVFGSIGKLTIDGAIKGGAAAFSGSIDAGSITDGTIGSLIGGAGVGSGKILVDKLMNLTINGDIKGGTSTDSGEIAVNGKIENVTINGNLVGGTAKHAGSIKAAKTITTLTINGSVIGGDGEESGSIGSDAMISGLHITGDLQGDDGIRSGTILSKSLIKDVTVDGSVVGGSALESGAIGSLTALADITVGNLKGGAGDRSGVIVSDALPGSKLDGIHILHSIIGDPGSFSAASGTHAGAVLGGTINSVTVDEDVVGGTGFASGVIYALKNIKSATVGGDLKGFSGFQSGTIIASGAITNVEIGGDIIGGSNNYAGSIFGAENLGTATIHGSVLSGTSDRAGSIYSPKLIKTVIIDGTLSGFGDDATGSATFGGTVYSEGTIQSVTIGGDIIGGSAATSGAVIGHMQPVFDLVSTSPLSPSSKSGPLPVVKTVLVKGSIKGGSANRSGGVFSDGTLESVTVIKDVVGGSANFSGGITSAGKLTSVTINGLLIGGTGNNYSGVVATTGLPGRDAIVGTDIGTVVIKGGIDGRAGNRSGIVSSSGNAGTISVGGLRGGGGLFSAAIIVKGNATQVEILGDIDGNRGDESGVVEVFGSAKTIIVAGNITATSGNYDFEDDGVTVGQIFVAGSVDTLSIGGSVTGGVGNFSGHVRAGSFKNVFIKGSISGADGEGSGGLTAYQSDIGTLQLDGSLEGGAGIMAGHIGAARNLGTLTIGSIDGTASGRAHITAGGVLSPKSEAAALALRTLNVGNSVSYADIFAGYDIDGAPKNPDAQIGTVEVGMANGSTGDWFASNLVAGAVTGKDAASDGEFGTSDDSPISFVGENPKIISKIANVIIHGDVLGDSTGTVSTHFGFVAAQLTKMSVLGSPIVLSPGPATDFLDLSNNTSIFELGTPIT